MTPFEYVTVLISIILGLGITQIVTGVGDIIHQWSRMKLYWPHTLWILLAFVMHIQEWWYTYELKKFDSWHLSSFLFVSLYPIMLFVLARILFPFGAMETETDFKAFYFKNYRKFFLLVILLAILSIIQDVSSDDASLSDLVLEVAIIVTLSIVSIWKLSNERLHQIIVVILFTTFIASFAFLDYTIA